MVGYGKAQAGIGVTYDPETDAYDGKGIWFRSGPRHALHRVPESAEFRDLLEAQCVAIGESTRAIHEAFGIDDPGGRWDIVPDQARFTFTRQDGRKCHARYGVVGSWNPETHSWLWAWGFPEAWVPAPVRRVADRLHALGRTRGWQALTERTLFLDDHEAWHMAKLGAYLAGYPLVYSARVNEKNRHFYAIDRPVWLT